MKKLYISLFLILSFSLAYGINLDGGATIDSFVGYSIKEDPSFFGYEKLSLYSSVMFSKNTSLALDGFYKFSYQVQEEELNHIFDMNTLLFSSSFNLGGRKLSYQLGRGFKSDFGGDIFAHNLDGISIVAPLSFATLYVHTGYTGLIHREETSLIDTFQDRTEDEERDNVRLLVEGVDIVKETDYMNIWGSVYSYQDFRPENLGKNLAIYVGGGVKGLLATSFYYSVRGNFKTGTFSYSETGADDEELESSAIVAGMGAISLDWFPTEGKLGELKTMASFKFGLSSGDSELVNGEIGGTQGEKVETVYYYSPIISSGPGNVYSISNSNLTYAKLTGSVSPIENLQVLLGGATFFRTVEGVSGNSSIDSESSGNYLGTEIYVTGNYRLLSDLGLSVNGGINIPNEDITGEEVSGLISAYLSLSL